jgi:hypothetical protein
LGDDVNHELHETHERNDCMDGETLAAEHSASVGQRSSIHGSRSSNATLHRKDWGLQEGGRRARISFGKNIGRDDVGLLVATVSYWNSDL